MKKKRIGFTLVELIVVIVILGILAVIAVPAYNSYADKAKRNRAITDVSATHSVAYALAIEEFALNGENIKFPTKVSAKGIEYTVECLVFQESVCYVNDGPEDGYSWHPPILDGKPEIAD